MVSPMILPKYFPNCEAQSGCWHTDLHQLSTTMSLVVNPNTIGTSWYIPGRECRQGERVSIRHVCDSLVQSNAVRMGFEGNGDWRL